MTDERQLPRVFLRHLVPLDYLTAVREGLDHLQFGKQVDRSTAIFVKPNLTFPNYREGVMTSPAAVQAALTALLDYTPRVYVGDSDSGGYNRFSMDSVYGATGLRDFAARNGITVVNLSHGPRDRIDFSAGRRQLSVDLPRLLTQEVDFLVTMPVPKVHMYTGVSLTFKNQWGCIPEPTARLRLHPYFKDTILAVNRAVKARFAIVDGRVGLTESGPMKGTPVRLDWLLVSDDIGAAARVCCELMQIDLSSVKHLRHAHRKGQVPRLDEIEVSADLGSFRRDPFFLKLAWTDLPGRLAFQSRQLAYVAYFSPLSRGLHRLLYLFREPFYDYAGEQQTLADESARSRGGLS